MARRGRGCSLHALESHRNLWRHCGRKVFSVHGRNLRWFNPAREFPIWAKHLILLGPGHLKVELQRNGRPTALEFTLERVPLGQGIPPIWQKLDRYVKVTVVATYLGETPDAHFEYGESAYAEAFGARFEN